MNKKELYEYIDENKGIFEELSDEIWEYAEISLKEHKSAEAYKKLLEKLGFKVETGLAGVETAFSERGFCRHNQSLPPGGRNTSCQRNMDLG